MDGMTINHIVSIDHGSSKYRFVYKYNIYIYTPLESLDIVVTKQLR